MFQRGGVLGWRKLTVCRISSDANHILNSARYAKAALLRGEDIQVTNANNLNYISTQLEAASELHASPIGISPTQAMPPNATATMSHGASNGQVKGHAPNALLPSLPVDNSPSRSRRTSVAPAPVLTGHNPYVQASPVTPDFGHVTPPVIAQPPPLLHSHSYPITGAHHVVTSPISPLHPSQSFAGALPAGVTAAHAPVISSPLANMAVNGITTPPRYAIDPAQQQWIDMRSIQPGLVPGEGVIVPHAPHHHTMQSPYVSMPVGGGGGGGGGASGSGSGSGSSRRVSIPDSHAMYTATGAGEMYSPNTAVSATGRPVINRSRSASLNKSWSTLNMNKITTTRPPSAWSSRLPSPASSSSDSEDERPSMAKRRRSSGARSRQRKRSPSTNGRSQAQAQAHAPAHAHHAQMSGDVDDGDMPDLSILTGPMMSEDVRRQMDIIFEDFLDKICSDRESSLTTF